MQTEDEKHFILSLIENVEKVKCLYDKNDAFYYNRIIREKAWDEIGDICGRSGADCKHRWKLVRERFAKELKKIESSTSSGKQEWIFMRPLMFLKASLGSRHVPINVKNQDTESASGLSEESLMDPLTLPTPVPQKKLKTCQKLCDTFENVERNFQSQSENATDEAFMKTVLCLLKDLPIDVKDDFQARMLQELYTLRKDNRNFQKLVFQNSLNLCKVSSSPQE